MSEQGTLIYLYGIVPGDAPPPPGGLTGVEDGTVDLIRLGEVAAIVSRVPAELYSDESLNERLGDLSWVGSRGLEHERVLDWYADRGPVIPLSLFSLHRDPSRVEVRVRGEAAAFRELLQRLQGRREWGVKLWRRDSSAREGIDRLSPSLQALSREIEGAPPGRRYLLERRRETMRAEEVRSVSKKIAHEVFGTLRGAADDAVTLTVAAAAAPGDRHLLLHAAYLVSEDDFEEFQRSVNAQATRLAGSGFELEFTGPWPPYHFTEANDA